MRVDTRKYASKHLWHGLLPLSLTLTGSLISEQVTCHNYASLVLSSVGFGITVQFPELGPQMHININIITFLGLNTVQLEGQANYDTMNEYTKGFFA